MLKESQLNKAQVSRQCSGGGGRQRWNSSSRIAAHPPAPSQTGRESGPRHSGFLPQPPASSCEDRGRPPLLCRVSPQSSPAAGAAANCRLTPACNSARSSPIMMESWIRISSGDELRSVRTSWTRPRTLKIKTWCLQKENICSAGSGPQRGNFLCV